MSETKKQSYGAPALVVYGTIGELTHNHTKTGGTGDGLTYECDPIHYVSCADC